VVADGSGFRHGVCSSGRSRGEEVDNRLQSVVPSMLSFDQHVRTCIGVTIQRHNPQASFSNCPRTMSQAAWNSFGIARHPPRRFGCTRFIADKPDSIFSSRDRSKSALRRGTRCSRCSNTSSVAPPETPDVNIRNADRGHRTERIVLHRISHPITFTSERFRR
jgi:hypothetical protein